MQPGGFGQSGQAQSQQYAFQACVICRAPIRVSFFLLAFFGFQVFNSLRNGVDIWGLLFLAGQQVILILTVLCHEFGHGNAARYIGGEIDHILLWPFGGICFSSRPDNVIDRRTLLRNDLGVVAAGPATHFLMTPAWALLLAGLGALLQAKKCHPYNCFSCEGMDCVWAFVKPLGDIPGPLATPEGLVAGDFGATVWGLLGIGIRLNVTLFLFNVFFPMYPADGAKLLTVSLMHCFGTSERFAATALIWSSSISAGLLILYALYRWKQGALDMMMPTLMGMMGVMSLVEAYRIYKLREERRLHMHPLFKTARSTTLRGSDGQGAFNRVNQWDLDDPVERQGAQPICCFCPCWLQEASASDSEETEMPRRPQPALQPSSAALGGARSSGDPRTGREGFLSNIEGQQAHRAKTVRQLEEERLRGASSG